MRLPCHPPLPPCTIFFHPPSVCCSRTDRSRQQDLKLFSSCFITVKSFWMLYFWWLDSIIAVTFHQSIEAFHPLVLKFGWKNNVLSHGSILGSISVRYLRLFWPPLAFHLDICSRRLICMVRRHTNMLSRVLGHVFTKCCKNIEKSLKFWNHVGIHWNRVSEQDSIIQIFNQRNCV